MLLQVNSSQRASSQSMEWKRVVKASIRFGDTNHSSSLGNTPDSRPRMIESLTGGAQADPKDKGGTLFPDSWMEQPCEPPFIFSFASTDLTGNRACFQVRPPHGLPGLLPGPVSDRSSLHFSRDTHRP